MFKRFLKLTSIALAVVGLYRNNFRLGRIRERALDAYYTFMTQNEMRNIGMAIAVNYRLNGELPDVRDCNNWLRQHVKVKGKASDLDYFGQPYRLEIGMDHFRLISSGPDRIPDTEDDLEERFEIEIPESRDY